MTASLGASPPNNSPLPPVVTGGLTLVQDLPPSTVAKR